MHAGAYEFREFDWQQDKPDTRTDRLCREASGGELGECRLEGASFLDQPTTAARRLNPAGAGATDGDVVIVAYNVERGQRWQEQVEALTDERDCPRPDILLLSETDRGCSRTGYRNVAREYARALRMCYAFATEFVELPRRWGAGGSIESPCEHGNAIVSRFPLGNVRAFQHRANVSWRWRYVPVIRFGEPRLGGRTALSADARIGDKYLRLYAVHFESGGRLHLYRGVRESQADEVADDALKAPHGVMIGGDMNTGRYLGELRDGKQPGDAAGALAGRGFADAHAGLPPERRATSRSGAAVDLIFGRGVEFLEAGICDSGRWRRLSDHLPVWAKLRVA